MNMGGIDLEGLGPEVRAKVEACQTPDDILALAKAEGYELSDEQLERLSGGDWDDLKNIERCPECRSAYWTRTVWGDKYCTLCHHTW